MNAQIATIIASIGSALLTGAITLLVTLVNSRAQNDKYIAQLDKQASMQDLRLVALEKKVDQHNHLDRRIVALEEQTKTIFNALDELKKE